MFHSVAYAKLPTEANDPPPEWVRLKKWSPGVPPKDLARIVSPTVGSALAFGIIFVIYMLASIVFIAEQGAFPPRGKFELESGTWCVDAFREAHYATARLYVGTPLRLQKLLIRLDTVEECTQHRPSVILTSSDVLHSDSLICTPDDVCTDVSIYTRWVSAPSGAFQEHVMQPLTFRYGSNHLYSNEADFLDLDGEIVLCSGTRYVLSAREFCANTNIGEDTTCSGSQLQWDTPLENETSIKTNACALQEAGGVWKRMPVAEESCNCTQPIDLWAVASAYQQSWLPFSDKHLYDLGETDTVRFMRSLIEQAGTCVVNSSDLLMVQGILDIACRDQYSITCSRNPSIPYGRLAEYRLDIRVFETRGGCISASYEPQLENVSQADTSSVIWDSWLHLFLMITAAAIVWIRREDQLQLTDRLFVRCAEIAIDGSTREIIDVDTQTSLLGLVAAILRIILSLTRWDTFVTGGVERVISIQYFVGALSLIHWMLLFGGRFNARFAWIKTSGLRPAFGGSSALIDICSCAMIAYTQMPLRASNGGFHTVARLLTVVLISLTCIARCMYSAAGAPVLLSTAAKQRANVHQSVLGILVVLLLFFWALQVVALAILVVDLFAVPTAIEWMRGYTGYATHTVIIVASITTALAGPRLTGNALLVSYAVSNEKAH